MYLCLGIQSALDSTILAVKKNCSVESGDTSTRLGVLLKICLFAWDSEVQRGKKPRSAGAELSRSEDTSHEL